VGVAKVVAQQQNITGTERRQQRSSSSSSSRGAGRGRGGGRGKSRAFSAASSSPLDWIGFGLLFSQRRPGVSPLHVYYGQEILAGATTKAAGEGDRGELLGLQRLHI